MRPSVLVVDDHEGFRAEARAMFEGEGFEVVGEAADGTGALAAVARLRPGIVVLDVGLPDASGLDLVDGIRDGSLPEGAEIYALDDGVAA